MPPGPWLCITIKPGGRCLPRTLGSPKSTRTVQNFRSVGANARSEIWVSIFLVVLVFITIFSKKYITHAAVADAADHLQVSIAASRQLKGSRKKGAILQVSESSPRQLLEPFRKRHLFTRLKLHAPESPSAIL